MDIFSGITILRQPVTSSNIKSIGFLLDLTTDPQTNGTLDVEFMNGSVYRYFGVPQDIARELMLQRSINAIGPTTGALFAEKVRKAGFRFEKLEAPRTRDGETKGFSAHG